MQNKDSTVATDYEFSRREIARFLWDLLKAPMFVVLIFAVMPPTTIATRFLMGVAAVLSIGYMIFVTLKYGLAIYLGEKP